MRRSFSQLLSDAQISRLETRRKILGLTRAALLNRFEEALQREGCVHTFASARMRLDRVLNPRLRRPTSEATLIALAAALDWTFLDVEAALEITESKRSLGLVALTVALALGDWLVAEPIEALTAGLLLVG